MKFIHHGLLILCALLLASGCASSRVGQIRIGDTPARRIAKDLSVPGKGVNGQCLPYARALHQRFQAAGIPSRVITYNYESLVTPRKLEGLTGAHAVVAYEDDGRTYMIDNQSWLPVWVRDASPDALARQFSGQDFNVLSARSGEPTHRL